MHDAVSDDIRLNDGCTRTDDDLSSLLRRETENPSRLFSSDGNFPAHRHDAGDDRVRLGSIFRPSFRPILRHQLDGSHGRSGYHVISRQLFDDFGIARILQLRQLLRSELFECRFRWRKDGDGSRSGGLLGFGRDHSGKARELLVQEFEDLGCFLRRAVGRFVGGFFIAAFRRCCLDLVFTFLVAAAGFSERRCAHATERYHGGCCRHNPIVGIVAAMLNLTKRRSLIQRSRHSMIAIAVDLEGRACRC
mmetsp:Transcript_9207/g.26301  ORF Transcript_9207/g.26301 Transcript_9207/m.26301 type:complete len:249 (+) Transcript_9207:236-982(+)